VTGWVGAEGDWYPEAAAVRVGDTVSHYQDLSEVREPYRGRLEELVRRKGLAHVGLVGYTLEHGQLPQVDWATIAAFAAIAGLGGLANTLFSNYTRDKGWGMGKYVGAIPSAVGGRNISLSHVGRVFPLDAANRTRWLGWLAHIRRDQMIWMAASFIGMALPCM